MPEEIVTDTCPAPQCNLSEQDIEQFLDEMNTYIALFAPAFQRVEQDEAHQDQREACGVPADLPAKTKPEIGLELLRRALQRDRLSFQWVAPMNCTVIHLLFATEWPSWANGISPKSNVPL